MHSTQINYLTEAGRTIYEYRPRVPLFAPQVGLWCLIAGLPLGVASATLFTVLDLIAVKDIVPTALIGTVILAIALYVLLRMVTRARVVLSVTFDVLAGTAEIYRYFGHPPIFHCNLLEITSFNAETSQSGFQRTCTISMSRTGRQDVILLEVDKRCHAESRLVNLTERLNMALETSQAEIINPPPLTQPQAYVPPTVMRPAVPPQRAATPEPSAAPRPATAPLRPVIPPQRATDQRADQRYAGQRPAVSPQIPTDLHPFEDEDFDNERN